MEHPLDNPAWSALITGNSDLAIGADEVKYFDSEVSPFVGFKENTVASFQKLYEVLTGNRVVLFVSPAQIDTPANWKQVAYIPGVQMVHEGQAVDLADDSNIIALTAEHIPQMLALTKLTNPGPFGMRTIEFGHYTGIFDGDQLVAMAGQRLHTGNYMEISAVCTHPDHLGKGYARKLLQYQVNRIKKAAGIPYLHSRDDNHRAIKVYETIGFTTRIPVYFYLLKKATT